jgi:solute carrier family 8 (sodium/calcium exchanger)
MIEEGIVIHSIVTDRHVMIAKWLRENLHKTKHFFDVWHLAKSE